MNLKKFYGNYSSGAGAIVNNNNLDYSDYFNKAILKKYKSEINKNMKRFGFKKSDLKNKIIMNVGTGVEALSFRQFNPKHILGGVDVDEKTRTSALVQELSQACDELTGFIVACTKVRPNGISDLKAKSVKKSLKKKSFAASVDRNEIKIGVELIHIELDAHIDNIINILKENSTILELKT